MGRTKRDVAASDLLKAAQGVLQSAGFTSGECEPTLRELRVNVGYMRDLHAAVAFAQRYNVAYDDGALREPLYVVQICPGCESNSRHTCLSYDSWECETCKHISTLRELDPSARKPD